MDSFNSDKPYKGFPNRHEYWAYWRHVNYDECAMVEWLTIYGFSKYIDVFQKNHMRLWMFPSLEDYEFDVLGVKSKDRFLFLCAIEDLKNLAETGSYYANKRYSI